MIRRVPIDPPPSRWAFPPPSGAVAEVVGVGADLEPGTLLAAYRAGLFPMRLEPGGPVGWWAPDPRGIIPLDGLHVSRSLRRAARDVEIRIDTAFGAVVAGCADPSRPHGWIDDAFIDAYLELHRLGWAHSVESWYQDELVGGLYGVAIGGLFAAESKYQVRRDASKVALVGLVELLRARGGRLLDVQWTTPHLRSLGAVDVPRDAYQRLLADALATPVPSSFERVAG
jgi:leucyl/phenylalanyl-tRNA--protein transferase